MIAGVVGQVKGQEVIPVVPVLEEAAKEAAHDLGGIQGLAGLAHPLLKVHLKQASFGGAFPRCPRLALIPREPIRGRGKG